MESIRRSLLDQFASIRSKRRSKPPEDEPLMSRSVASTKNWVHSIVSVKLCDWKCHVLNLSSASLYTSIGISTCEEKRVSNYT